MEIPRKYMNFISNIIIIFIIIVGSFIFFNTIFKWLLPFILAYLMASITNPVINLMENKLKMPRKIACLTTILFSLFFIVSFIFIIFSRVIFEIKNLAEMSPKIAENISNVYNEIFIKGIKVYDTLPFELSRLVDTLLNVVLENSTSLISSAAESVTRFAYNVAKSLPSILLFIIVLFISTYFIATDREKISKFLHRQIPSSWFLNIITIKNDLVIALFGYIKAQIILMTITFIEISIGMTIIGVNYPLLIALIISLIDALPILGTGIILIPWALFSLLSGNFTFAVYLIILYSIVLLVRQSLEPKIVGKQIGLYPLVTLMSMYIGLKLFGAIGIILGPITVLVVKSLLRTNIWKSWKE